MVVGEVMIVADMVVMIWVAGEDILKAEVVMDTDKCKEDVICKEEVMADQHMVQWVMVEEHMGQWVMAELTVLSLKTVLVVVV